MLHRDLNARLPADQPGQLENGQLARVPNVDRTRAAVVEEPYQALDLVVHIAERSGLGPVAVDREGPTAQRLVDEVGDDPSVVGPQARAVGVEYPGDANVHAVRAVVGRSHRFGEALGLVVDAPGPYGVDVAPVVFALRANQGVPVHLRRRGQQVARAVAKGDSEGDVRAQAAHLQRLDRHPDVVRRTRRRREVQDPVQLRFDRERNGHVLHQQLEARISFEVG